VEPHIRKVCAKRKTNFFDKVNFLFERKVCVNLR